MGEHQQKFILTRSTIQVQSPRNQIVLEWKVMRLLDPVEGEWLIGPIIQPSTEIADQLTSIWVENELNTSDCFEGGFVPQKNDWLTIHEAGHGAGYLSFLFRGKSWRRDQRLNLRVPFEEILSGTVKYAKLAQRRMS